MENVIESVAKNFKYGKWALIFFIFYVSATIVDTLSLYSNITEHLKISSDVRMHIMSEVTKLSLFHFTAGAMFGLLAGAYFYRRMLRKGG